MYSFGRYIGTFETTKLARLNYRYKFYYLAAIKKQLLVDKKITAPSRRLLNEWN